MADLPLLRLDLPFGRGREFANGDHPIDDVPGEDLLIFEGYS